MTPTSVDSDPDVVFNQVEPERDYVCCMLGLQATAAVPNSLGDKSKAMRLSQKDMSFPSHFVVRLGHQLAVNHSKI